MPTTIGYHQLILDTADFRAGNVDTGFIPSHAEELAEPPTTGKLVRVKPWPVVAPQMQLVVSPLLSET